MESLEAQIKALMLDHERDLKKKDSEVCMHMSELYISADSLSLLSSKIDPHTHSY